MVKRVKSSYYKVGETARGKEMFVIKGSSIFSNFREIGGILEIKRTKWYLVLSWYNGQRGITDIVKEFESKKQGVIRGEKLKGKRIGRWKEPTGRI